jgi:hypothetical protein
MTLPRAYAPILPEFDAFLFASIGEEVDGVPLSVLSALSRLDLDPREEAVRLAHLTREAAADQLARMIARLYDRRWSVAEALRIARGLVERLPVSRAAGTTVAAAAGVRLATHIPAASLLIYLALGLAVLTGLVAGSTLFLGS